MGCFTYGYLERLPPELYEEMKRCTATYKRLRPTLGELGVLSGAQLMREGLACRLEARRRAQVYILMRQED